MVRLLLVLGLMLLAPGLPGAGAMPAHAAGHGAMAGLHGMAPDAGQAPRPAQDPACVIACIGMVGVADVAQPPVVSRQLLAAPRPPAVMRLAGRATAPRGRPPKPL